MNLVNLYKRAREKMETYEFMKRTGERTNRTRQVYSNWAKARGVNYNVMAVLYTAYHNDKCSQKYICEEWSVPKQTVNTTCRDLMAAGIIEQSQSTGDKRETCISLTEKGKAFAYPLVNELLEIEGRILGGLGEEKIKLFFDLLIAYTETVEKEFAVK